MVQRFMTSSKTMASQAAIVSGIAILLTQSGLAASGPSRRTKPKSITETSWAVTIAP